MGVVDGICKPRSPRLQLAHPLTSGLQRAWLFHEGSGPPDQSVREQIRNRAPGVNGTAPSWQRGPMGSYLDFASGSNYLTVESTNYGPDVTISIIFLFKSFANFFLLYDGASNWIYVNSSTTIQFIASGGGGSTTVPTWTANTWYHVICTKKGGAAAIWLNGVKYTPASIGSGNFQNITRIGQSSQTCGIAHVLVWNRQLSENGVLSVQRDPYQMFRPTGPIRIFIPTLYVPVHQIAAALMATVQLAGSVTVVSQAAAALVGAADLACNTTLVAQAVADLVGAAAQLAGANQVAQAVSGLTAQVTLAARTRVMLQVTATWTATAALAGSLTVPATLFNYFAPDRLPTAKQVKLTDLVEAAGLIIPSSGTKILAIVDGQLVLLDP